MQIELFIITLYSFFILLVLVMLAMTLLRKEQANRLRFSITLILALGVVAVQLLASDWTLAERITRDYLLWLVLIAMMSSLGHIVLRDTLATEDPNTLARGWLAISALWLASFTISAAISTPIFAGWSVWSTQLPLIPALIGSIGFVVCAVYLLGRLFYRFYRAPMPEVANRMSFWIVVLGTLLAGVTLIAGGSVLFMLPGTLALMLSLMLTQYGIQHYRLVDMRSALLQLAQTSSIVLMSWALIFATLYFLTIARVSDSLQIADELTSIMGLAIISLMIAVIIVLIRQVIQFSFLQINGRTRTNLAQATATYSQRVARAATLEEVVEATTETLNRVMGVDRSALILINNTVRVKDSVELIVLEKGASLNQPSSIGYLHEQSPLYYALAKYNSPIGQYDIDYSPTFSQLAPQERQFFRDIQMSAYVPVSADNRLIGLLASGSKRDDTPYSRDDIETLYVIGQQVGTALRSARLIDDLQHLNDSMRVLNKRLENAKIELEKLDNIKTDFITIASHELRTPLAQIRGYTDILDSLNQSNALKEGQAEQIVGNLRRSTERMEELISAMLDVSQIDVNSMDLRFIQTSPETIIKMALDPLRDPADERHIEIIRHNAKDLPNVEADLQRMVQALRNIVLNAIKFTPDGGKIEISATLETAQAQYDIDNILFKIADTGVGIDQKDIPFIFNKFYRAFDTQLHSTGIYKFMGAGPGLGLTIAKGIVEGHGGHIWVESSGHDMDNPQGSIFYVRLPIQPPSGTRRVQPFADDMNRTQAPLKRTQ
ncbi:MAG: ATP-binding protein [Anaerolineae bacterium]